MLNPKELKGVTFKKNLGGNYNASEVDDFLAGLIDDYTKIYTDNAELSMKLELMAERLAAYKGEEQKLKTAVANVKLLCDNLIKDANEKSEKIVKTAMAERDSIVSALEDTVRQKRSEIETINASVAEYKENMIFKYKMHIDAINSLPLFDVKASEELVTKSEEKLEKLKIHEQEIPVLLNEKKEIVEEVAEFIEPTEPKAEVATPAVMQEQQVIKAKVVGTRKIDTATTVFEKQAVKAEKTTSEPTVVFDSKEVIKKAKETKKAEKAFVFTKEEETVPEEKPVEGQTTFGEVEPEIEVLDEPVKEYVKPTEDILQNFAPKQEKAEEKKEEPKAQEDDEIDAPAFLKNRRRPKTSEQEKRTLIENIKNALAEKEEEERIRIEQEEAEEKEMESIVTSALPIDDEEADEKIESKFKDDIRFGSDFDYDDDDDDDDDDDGFFSFFKSK